MRRSDREKSKADREQSARFIEAAKKSGADESGKAFEKAFKKIAKQTKPRKERGS